MLKETFHFLLRIVFPITCSGCGKDLPEEDYSRLCPGCRNKIEFIKGFFCKKCGLPLPDGGAHCFNCKKKTGYHFEFIRSACIYQGIIRDLIHKFKYRNRDYLDRVLGKFLIKTIEEEPLLKDVDAVIPVPMHFIKKLARGYDQAELLAKVVSNYIQKPILKDLLYRKRFTKAQFTLSKKRRLGNIKNSFALRNNEIIKDKTVLLIDDICTTIATIEECSIILKQGGTRKIYGLTLARD